MSLIELKRLNYNDFFYAFYRFKYIACDENENKRKKKKKEIF